MSASWKARWIWAANEPAPFSLVAFDRATGAPRSCLLRRSFVLDSPSAHVPARVTADARYVLFVNGQEVARGPARAAVDRRTWAEVDLGPSLVAGENVVAALVRWYGRPGPWWVPVVPWLQLGYGSFLFEAAGIGLVSDGRWRGIDGPYLDPGEAGKVMGAFPTAPDEIVDLVALPEGWAEAGFDDEAWPVARELQGRADASAVDSPFGALEPDDLPGQTARDVDLTRRGDVWDTGGIVLATPSVEVEGPAGAEVTIAVGEDLDDHGCIMAEPRRWTMRVRCDGTRRRVEALDAIGFRYLQTQFEPGVQVHAVGATERVHPRTPVGSFDSDDARVNAVWQAAARSLEVCSTDTFEDCPGRERRSWLGDGLVQALATYALDGDWSLPRRHLRLAAASVRGDGFLPMILGGDLALAAPTIVEWSMDFARSLARHMERAGSTDVELIASVAPVVTLLLGAVERSRGPDGLLHDVPGWVFVDWAPTERGPVTGYLDARYAAALRDHATVLDWLGDDRTARILRRRADCTTEAFEVLWDAERGVYVDAIRADGTPGRRVSQHTNAAALAGGVAPAERWPSIVDGALRSDVATITRIELGPAAPFEQRAFPKREDGRPFDESTDVVAAQPVMLHVVHEALGLAGRGDLIVESILRWHPVIEELALADPGKATLPEMWTHQPGATSRAHGVTATVAHDLVHHVLGLRILEPGFASIRLSPSMGGLTWATATVPTPHGDLRVHIDDDGVRVEAPDGISLANDALGAQVAGRRA
ncbi:MAG TPA: hypothetical protein VM933_05075 [Acidimicrobiales bacterium]|nr:hypothetical protein [Acidimicrobiales bacterium]